MGFLRQIARSHPQSFWFNGWSRARKFAYLTSSWGVLLLLVPGRQGRRGSLKMKMQQRGAGIFSEHLLCAWSQVRSGYTEAKPQLGSPITWQSRDPWTPHYILVGSEKGTPVCFLEMYKARKSMAPTFRISKIQTASSNFP